MTDNPAWAAFVARQRQALLGCDWGRKIGVRGDCEPCPRKACVQFILHADDGERDVKVCAEHAAVVESLTDPHPEG